MMTITHSDSIQEHDLALFGSLDTQAVPVNHVDKAVPIQRLDLAFEEAADQRIFFDTLVKQLLLDYDLYFYYVEKKATPPTRVRSHKKLMYAHRSHIGDVNLYEEEVGLSSQKTLIYSVIALTADNVAYVLDTLLNSLFSFAFMHKKVKNTTASRKTMALLTKVVEASATPVRSIFELNSYLLLETLLNEKSAVIKLMQDGHNVNHISVFYTNDFHAVAIRNKALAWEQHTRVL